MLEFKYFVETIPRHKNHVCNLRLRVVFVLVVPPSFVGLCAILRGIASGAQVGSHVSNNICQHNVNCKVAIAMPMSISAAGPRYPGGLSPCIQLQLPMASKLPTTPINYSYSFPYCCRAASKLSTITTPMAIRMAVAQPRCYQPFVWTYPNGRPYCCCAVSKLPSTLKVHSYGCRAASKLPRLFPWLCRWPSRSLEVSSYSDG